MKSKNIKIFYWIATGFFALMMLSSCIADLMKIPEAVNIMTHLGFPVYLMHFMGIAKLLGLFALLIPMFHKIKEWAYAGFVFNLTAAIYAHIEAGDPAGDVMRPLFFLVFLALSYFLYLKVGTKTEIYHKIG